MQSTQHSAWQIPALKYYCAHICVCLHLLDSIKIICISRFIICIIFVLFLLDCLPNLNKFNFLTTLRSWKILQKVQKNFGTPFKKYCSRMHHSLKNTINYINGGVKLVNIVTGLLLNLCKYYEQAFHVDFSSFQKIVLKVQSG